MRNRYHLTNGLDTFIQLALDMGWEKSPTGHIWRQMLLTRARFARHPLYRYWNTRAFRTRFAVLAELIPEQLMQTLPVIVLLIPFVGIAIALIFGTPVFRAFLWVVAILAITLVMVMASIAPLITAAIAALSIIFERHTGRWDLVMLIPYDRLSVLVMRVASMLYPYRPLVATADILQTISAIITAIIVNAEAANRDDTLLAACFFFLLPALFLLTWERRQDYALSVAIGSYAGMGQQNALGTALGGALMLLAGRLMFGMLIFGVGARFAHSFNVVLPLFVGGPAMMPMLGFRLDTSILMLLLYYGLREGITALLWRGCQRRLHQ